MNAIRQQAAGRSPGSPARERQSELRRSYPAEAETVALARQEFGALAERHGATDEQVNAIRLLISEAVTNAVRHAYPDGPGTVNAIAAVAAGHMTIVVSDHGVGPHSCSPTPGAGWGWSLIAALTERCTVRHRRSGGTEVEMAVPLRQHCALE